MAAVTITKDRFTQSTSNTKTLPSAAEIENPVDKVVTGDVFQESVIADDDEQESSEPEQSIVQICCFKFICS